MEHIISENMVQRGSKCRLIKDGVAIERGSAIEIKSIFPVCVCVCVCVCAYQDRLQLAK